MDNDHLISTCQGIQLAYNARKAGLEQHLVEREIVAQATRDARSNLATATDPNTIRFLTRERNDLVDRLSEIDRKIATSQQQLQDLENDYQINNCEALIGSIG